ncbi:unnamed protein product [Closterium sp. NIES-54]
MALRSSSVPQCLATPSPSGSSLPDVPDPESDLARAAIPTVTRILASVVTDPSFESTAAFSLVTKLVDFAATRCLNYVVSLVTEQFELECLAAVLPRFASMLLCPEGDPDAPDIPIPRSYVEAITGGYSSQWQTAMDAEMASWKSTGTYVNEVPPPRVSIVDGMWNFIVKRPPGSPPASKARYIARGFSQRQGVDFFQTFSPTPKMTTLRVLLHVAAQRDCELHSLHFSIAFLQSSLHEEIWLHRPPGFTGSFPEDTYGTTLAALGFASSTADPSLFLHTDPTLPPLYILVYVDDLVFATADTETLILVKSELQKRHTCSDLGHSLSAPPSDESVEPSGPYLELVGCLMYLMTCTRPDLAYPLSILARFVPPGRHRKEHWTAAQRVLHYLCSTSSIGLVLGGRGSVVLSGHSDASWADDQATQRSSQGYSFSLGSGSFSWRSTRPSSVLGSSCEAEIYAGAMAAQELRWLTYLLTDLGERPRSPLVLTAPLGPTTIFDLPVLPCLNSVPHAALPAWPHVLCPACRAARLLPSARPARCPARALPCPALQPACSSALQPARRPALQPTRRPALQLARRPALQPMRRPALLLPHRPALQPAHHPALQLARRPALQLARRPALQPARHPALQLAHRPALEPAHRPALQLARRPALQPARRPALQLARRPALQPARCPALQLAVRPALQPALRPALQLAHFPALQPACRHALQPMRRPACELP